MRTQCYLEGPVSRRDGGNSSVGLNTIYELVGIAVGVTALGSVGWKSLGWLGKWRSDPGVFSVTKQRKHEDPDEDDEPQIACDNCHTVFRPKWKHRGDYDIAKCPHCGKENEFEVNEDDDDDDTDYDEEDDE